MVGESLSWNVEPDMPGLERAHGLLSTNPHKAEKQLKALAEQGSLKSMFWLGLEHAKGTFGKVDLTRAEEWYRRAADGGLLIATYYLGRLYLRTGQYDRARAEFMIGAAVDYMPDLHMLGRMYYKGIGVPRDFVVARPYLEKASALGSIFASGLLASLLMKGSFGFFQKIRGMYLYAKSVVAIPFAILKDPAGDWQR